MELSKRLPNETARTYATRVLEHHIISLELEPGTILSENELATYLGLSRTPVREALIDLSKVGIVEILPQKGSRISYINYDYIEEARFIRHMLEKGIVEILCDQGLSEEQITFLSENIQLQEFYLNNPSKDRQFFLDNQFHEKLFTFANRERSYRLIKRFNIHFDRVRHLSNTSSTLHDSQIVADHKQLLAYILASDKANACALVTAHLSRYTVDAGFIKATFKHYFAPSSL